MLHRMIRTNSILLTFFVLYLVVVVLALLELDRQYYQSDKNTLIQDNPHGFINHEVGEINIQKIDDLALKDLLIGTPETHQELVAAIRSILDEPNFLYRIVIRRAGPDTGESATQTSGSLVVDMSAPGKFKTQNNWSNSLFMSRFRGAIEKDILDDMNVRHGRLMINYTTPMGNAAIEELTARYRWYGLFLVVLLSIFAWAIAWSLLFPMRNVMNALEASTAEHTTFIARPMRRLELFYNRMALDAVIARMQGLLRDQIALHPELTGWEIVRLVCTMFREQVGTPLVAAIEMVSEGPGRVRPTGQKVLAGRQEVVSDTGLAERIDRALPRDGRNQASFDWTDEQVPLVGTVRVQADPERSGIRYLFALGIYSGAEAVPGGSLERMLDRLGSLVNDALQTLTLRNRLLVQERGRANISLSRNLGHDLTNIIATSKLELMALDRLLKSGEPPRDERRRSILVDSLQGLLRSVRFMQETVNLYRAYAYLQQPVLETTDGNGLVRETLELFEASISGRIELRAELAQDAPRCVVDPRLIKLALFNLFTNALDATRRLNQHQAEPWIRVRTRRAEDGGLEIIIEDSGTGILNTAGKKAAPHEIEKIFELGYSNRRSSDSRGEGLGLNWVRTIVQDLHSGTITAENSESAGARFTLKFAPLTQAVEDTVKA